MKRITIICTVIIGLTLILGGGAWYYNHNQSHIIEVKGKSVSLGNVYTQQVLSTVTISDANNNMVLVLTANNESLTSQLKKQLESDLKIANASLSPWSQMQLATAYFDDDIHMHFSSNVQYQTQNHANINVPLEGVTMTYSVEEELHFDELLDLVQHYQNKAQQTFMQHYQFTLTPRKGNNS